MDALALERVQIDRQSRDQGLALAGPHLGDLSAVEHDAADHLDVEVAHPEDSFSGFAHDSEGFGKEVAEEIVHLGVGAGFLELAAKLEGFPTQFVVGESKDVFFDRVDI